MELFFALLKLAVAVPFVAGVGMLVLAMLNLMYDPGAIDQPGAMRKQAVPLATPVLFVLLMFLLLAPMASTWLGQEYWPELQQSALPLWSTAILLVVAALVLGAISKSWPQALPFHWRRQPAMAYCLFAPLLALVAVCNRILVEDVFGGDMPFQVISGFSELSGWPLAGALLLIVLLVPWLEEILFRHYLWGALMKHPGFGPARALVFSSLAFTVLHPPVVWLPVFVLGVFLAWVRWRSTRLADAVVIHQIHNLVVVWLLTDFPS